MTQLSKTAFLSKWAGLFANNTTRDISEQDIRDFRQDIADSFINVVDTPSLIFVGAYAFPGGLFPTAEKAGTFYIATADHGNPGDADYVPTGMRFISLIDGADAFNEFTYF